MAPLRDQGLVTTDPTSPQSRIDDPYTQQWEKIDALSSIDAVEALVEVVRNQRAPEEVADLNTLKDRLYLLLVHDLKNPLSIVKVNLALMEDSRGLPNLDTKACLREAVIATDRVLAMIVDLLDIARAEEGNLKAKLAPCSLRELATSVAAGHRQMAERHSVAITVDDADVELEADGNMVRRVFENILANALRYVPHHGKIHFGFALRSGAAIITIENNGPRIPDEVLARLFDKYGEAVRKDEMASLSNRGLGMYFCRLVADAHHGSIRAYNRPTGVCFELQIPLTR